MDRPGSAKAAPRSDRDDTLQIVYEDDELLVADKPPGLLTVPLPRRHDEPSLADLIELHFRSRGKRRPHVVHRIDRDTSGLVLFARNRAQACGARAACALFAVRATFADERLREPQR
jgi:23S rRNA pseudouridine1911/1915/1917 synthase